MIDTVQTIERRAADASQGTILFGGSGFLGAQILRQYPDIISVGRSAPHAPNRHVSIESLCNLDALRKVSFNRVIYLIGNTDHQNLEREFIPAGEPTAFDYHVNLLIQTLEQLKSYEIKKFVHFSTILLYDEAKLALPVSENAAINPYQTRYVMSKYLGEEVCRFYSKWIPVINIRLSNIYGPTKLKRVDLIHRLVKQLLDDRAAKIWTTKPERDFIHIEDAARAVLQLLETDFMGTLNLGSGAMTSVRRIADVLSQVSGYPITDLDQPVSGPMRFQCDMRAIEKLIDWRPRYSIEAGLKQTYDSMKSWREGDEARH